MQPSQCTNEHLMAKRLNKSSSVEDGSMVLLNEFMAY